MGADTYSMSRFQSEQVLSAAVLIAVAVAVLVVFVAFTSGVGAYTTPVPERLPQPAPEIGEPLVVER